jgi:hypothetical protein
MAECEVCGNDYDDAFEVHLQDERHVFDCFESAVHALAPTCDNCGVRILGHGVETDTMMFCGASCAQQWGVSGFTDRL